MKIPMIAHDRFKLEYLSAASIGSTPSHVRVVAFVPCASMAVPCSSTTEGMHSVLKSSVELSMSCRMHRPSSKPATLRRTLLK